MPPPFRMAAQSHFDALRQFLQDTGYTQEGARRGDAPPLLELAVHLFYRGGGVHRSLLAHFPEPVQTALDALGLLAAHPTEAEVVTATVTLFPIGPLVLASDRLQEPDGAAAPAAADAVYAPTSVSTLHFLDSLPPLPCERFLELCAGTGVAALLAAKQYAGQAWSLDITQRATQFAGFNARLNGLDNVTVLQGDLFAPVEGLVFDRIAAHPPYMPTIEPHAIYRDAGPDGEAVLRRLVAGLARHLAPGGRCYIHGMFLDRRQEPFEQRVRSWLGEARLEFDVLFLIREAMDPVLFTCQQSLKAGGGMEDFRKWRDLFTSLGVAGMNVAGLVLERHRERRPPFTLRRTRTAQTTHADVERLLEWEAACQNGQAAALLAGAKPRLSPHATLTTLQKPVRGILTASGYTGAIAQPFVHSAPVEPWSAYLLHIADGTAALDRLLAMAKEQRLADDSVTLEQFARRVAPLVSAGLLEI